MHAYIYIYINIHTYMQGSCWRGLVYNYRGTPENLHDHHGGEHRDI